MKGALEGIRVLDLTRVQFDAERVVLMVVNAQAAQRYIARAFEGEIAADGVAGGPEHVGHFGGVSACELGRQRASGFLRDIPEVHARREGKPVSRLASHGRQHVISVGHRMAPDTHLRAVRWTRPRPFLLVHRLSEGLQHDDGRHNRFKGFGRPAGLERAAEVSNALVDL